MGFMMMMMIIIIIIIMTITKYKEDQSVNIVTIKMKAINQM